MISTGAVHASWDASCARSVLFGLYYGIVVRDVSEMITERMSCSIGYYSDTGLPPRLLEDDTCAVCGQKVSMATSENAVDENVYVELKYSNLKYLKQKTSLLFFLI
jgi:hypothetical protein